MASDEQRIEDLAEAVLDGDSIDWTAVELEGGTVGRLAKHLKVLAKLAGACREDPSLTHYATVLLPSKPGGTFASASVSVVGLLATCIARGIRTLIATSRSN